MGTTSGKLVQAAVRVELQAELKRAGFKKTALTFRRAGDDVIEIVNVQSSQWNFADTARFTLNLAIYVPGIAELLGWRPVTVTPKEHECPLRTRIGQLMPGGHDHWWEIHGAAGVEQPGRQAAAAFRDVGRPWLARHASVAKVAMVLASDPTVESAAAALLAGDEAAARKRIARVIAECPPAATGLAEAARAFRKRHGL